MTSHSLTGLVYVQSTETAQKENDVNCEERNRHLSFDSTADHSSVVSAMSSRPVLTRQGTFTALHMK